MAPPAEQQSPKQHSRQGRAVVVSLHPWAHLSPKSVTFSVMCLSTSCSMKGRVERGAWWASPGTKTHHATSQATSVLQRPYQVWGLEITVDDGGWPLVQVQHPLGSIESLGRGDAEESQA